MCDGKNSSKRDVVILSIKPKRPEFPSSQKVVPVTELLQEWDNLDNFYRGQLLKLTRTLPKESKSSRKHSRIPVNTSIHHTSSPHKVKKSSSKSSPVNKKHSNSLAADQFTELFGDENLFATNDTNNNSNRHSKHNNNKLLHSRSLNSLFEDPDGVASPPPNSRSRKNSLANANTNNLVVSIPVLSVPQNFGDNYSENKRNSKLFCEDDDDNQSYSSSDEEDEEAKEERNFLSVPRDNFQVQYGLKQKTRVTLLEAGGVSPRWIVPVHVAPYKPPAAQGLNGVQIQKILYHKNDSVNWTSPTTTTARTPDKPPDNLIAPKLPAKSISSNDNSPMSTVSPKSTCSSGTTPSPINDNNNATPKQTSGSTPTLSSPKTDQVKSVFAPPGKLSSPPPPINSTSGHSKMKRPSSLDCQTLDTSYGKKQKAMDSGNGFNFVMPVSSTSFSFSTGDSSELDNHGNHPRLNGKEVGSKSTSEKQSSPKKLNIIPKNPSSSYTKSSAAAAGDNQSGSPPVFLSPAAISITDRIIKKASMPQPELIERQRRRQRESDKRKSYAKRCGDEHEEKECIELSMKSFEMIWNMPLLSPLRSP